MGSPVQRYLKELCTLDLTFSLKNALSSQLLLNPLGDFDKTWYKERSQCAGVHITKEMMFPTVQRNYVQDQKGMGAYHVLFGRVLFLSYVQDTI
jgi:hypothetical protein